MNFAEFTILLAVTVVFALAAWQDFTAWRIRNWTVLALIGLYTVFAAVRWIWEPDGGVNQIQLVGGELGAAALLFMIGFALWVFGLLGAGDAKLFLPVGLFVGSAHLVQLSLLLLFGALATVIALKFQIPERYRRCFPTAARIDEIRRTGKVPYGVIIVGATFATMYMRFAGVSA